MNFYERHIGDYLKDTAHLSLLEHGVYTRLLDIYYTRESGIPQSEAARLIGARSRDDKQALAVVLAEFFTLSDGHYIQDRAEREIERLQDKRRKASASASARWGAERPQSERNANASRTHMQTDSERNANAMRTQSEGNARAPVPSPQSPVPSPQEEIPSDLRSVVASGPPAPPRLPPCPVDEVIALYHRHLPMLPRVGVVNEGRKRTLGARWREVVTDEDIRKTADPRAAALDWFSWFFEHASRSDFLTGKAKDWRADFDFLLTPSRFAKVIEGTYHKATA